MACSLGSLLSPLVHGGRAPDNAGVGPTSVQWRRSAETQPSTGTGPEVPRPPAVPGEERGATATCLVSTHRVCRDLSSIRNELGETQSAGSHSRSREKERCEDCAHRRLLHCSPRLCRYGVKTCGFAETAAEMKRGDSDISRCLGRIGRTKKKAKPEVASKASLGTGCRSTAAGHSALPGQKCGT